jgi:hypothetical protein
MAKYLKDILKQAHDTIKGVRSSEIGQLSIGKDPGVDYKPKAGDEADFIAKHSVQKWDDPAGNPNFADKVSHSLDKEKNHGNTQSKAKVANEEFEIDEAMSPKQKQFSNRVKTMPGKKGAVMGATSNFEAPFHKVHATISKDGGAKETVKHEIKAKDKHDAIFDVQMMHHKAGHKVHDVKHKGMVKEETDTGFAESKKAEDVLCNSTSQGTECPVHGMVECMSARPLKEVSKKTLSGYVQGATRDALSKQYSLGKGEKVDTRKLMNRRKGIDKAVDKMANEEVEQVEEGGMPASVIKSKQHRANMTDKEFADSHKDKSDADLRSMAWRHGHGKPGTPGHDHYVNRRNRGLKEEIEQIDELSTDLLHRAAHKAAKRAMGDAQGRSGPIFKKYAGMANKFRDKGMSQEKKEKAAKAVKEETVEEGANVDRMVAHVKSSEKAAGKSDKKAENIAWATANKRGMLDNKNKKVEEGVVPEPRSQLPNHGLTNSDASKMSKIAAMLKKEKKSEKIKTYRADRDKHMEEAYAVEPLLGGDSAGHDEGAEMVRAELKALANKAMHLVTQMPDSMHVEPWCQAKIAQAKSMVNDVHDYMIYGDHKDEEDEQTDTPITLPNMSVDVNTGQNV